MAGAFNWFRNQLFPDPSRGAMNYLDQIPGQMKPYYNPYINAGRGAMGRLQGAYGEMMDDPSAIISRLGAGYKQSPGFQRRMDQSMGAITNANASGGMTGTPQHEQQAAQMAGDLTSEDYNRYLDRAMGLYGGGVQGFGDMNKMGYGASTDLAQNLAQILMSKSNLNYAGQASQNKNTSDLLGALAGMMGGGRTGGGSNYAPVEDAQPSWSRR